MNDSHFSALKSGVKDIFFMNSLKGNNILAQGSALGIRVYIIFRKPEGVE
jgi:hypothetical protein